jgi:hypothetical protein
VSEKTVKSKVPVTGHMSSRDKLHCKWKVAKWQFA